MTRVILTTVGTSLKGNAERAGRPAAELLAGDPAAACAEANVLTRLLEPGDTVDLFHSQTPDGAECAREIGVWLRGRGHDANLIVIEGLTYKASDFHRGLRSLVRCLTARLREVRRTERIPILNALGGFKSEVAYATIVGALFGLPNYYMHQGFDELLEIPPLPVSWDMAAIDAHADVLEWLDAESRTEKQANSRLAQLPEAIRALIEPGGDGCVYLSPLGEAYFEAYRSRVETARGKATLSTVAADTLQKMSPSVLAAFTRVMSRLMVPEIRRAGSKTLERDHGDVLVFPRGHVNERIFWFEEAGTLTIVEFARHGEEYENLYRKGVFKDKYSYSSMASSS